MGVIQRGAKASGGTEFATGTAIRSDEVNTDFNTVYSEINGNLTDANISNSAGVNPLKVDDVSASATAMAVTSNPGTPDAENLPVNLGTEVLQLRYAIGRIAQGNTGSNVKRYDGSEKNVPWFDRVARGPNLIRNSSFEAQSGGAGTAPDGWTLAGTPTTAALVDTDVAFGDGKALRIVADAANEGVQQTVAGLRASTTYLLTASIKVAVGTVKLLTTGADAASEYRNSARTSTSATATQLNVVIQTDSTPTDIVVQVVSNASADDFQVDHVGLYELREQVSSRPGYLAVSDSSNVTTGTLDTTRRAFPDGDALAVSVTVPGPGYSIRVTADLFFTDNAANTMLAHLEENTVDVAIAHAAIPANEGGCVSLHYLNTSPTPGTTYTYGVDCQLRTGAGTNNGTVVGGITARSRLTAELIPPG